jgi:hypothetical protein
MMDGRGNNYIKPIIYKYSIKYLMVLIKRTE